MRLRNIKGQPEPGPGLPPRCWRRIRPPLRSGRPQGVSAPRALQVDVAGVDRTGTPHLDADLNRGTPSFVGRRLPPKATLGLVQVVCALELVPTERAPPEPQMAPQGRGPDHVHIVDLPRPAGPSEDRRDDLDGDGERTDGGATAHTSHAAGRQVLVAWGRRSGRLNVVACAHGFPSPRSKSPKPRCRPAPEGKPACWMAWRSSFSALACLPSSNRSILQPALFFVLVHRMRQREDHGIFPLDGFQPLAHHIRRRSSKHRRLSPASMRDEA